MVRIWYNIDPPEYIVTTSLYSNRNITSTIVPGSIIRTYVALISFIRDTRRVVVSLHACVHRAYCIVDVFVFLCKSGSSYCSYGMVLVVVYEWMPRKKCMLHTAALSELA